MGDKFVSSYDSFLLYTSAPAPVQEEQLPQNQGIARCYLFHLVVSHAPASLKEKLEGCDYQISL